MARSTGEPVKLDTHITAMTEKLITHRHTQYYNPESIEAQIESLTGAQLKQVFKELANEKERVAEVAGILTDVTNKVRKAVMSSE